MIDFLKQVFNAQEVMRLAATYQRAIAVGATSVQAPVGQFYGDRSGGVKDPCGNLWWIAKHIEDVPPDELKRRAEEAMRKAGG